MSGSRESGRSGSEPAPPEFQEAFELVRPRLRRLGSTLVFFPTVGSTNDAATALASRTDAAGMVVFADEQTAGRGRLGRSWVTPPALNLASTVIVRPPASALRDLAMITPLAICQAVEGHTAVGCDIKWPNDVQTRGKKLAGVLIETDLSGATPLALVGAGINVNFDPREHEEIREIATSLFVETGAQHDREALLASYLLHFERLYDATCAGRSPRDAWRGRLVTLGQHVIATTPSGQVEGIAEDVDDDGSLLIRTADGALSTVEAGDVTLRH